MDEFLELSGLRTKLTEAGIDPKNALSSSGGVIYTVDADGVQTPLPESAKSVIDQYKATQQQDAPLLEAARNKRIQIINNPPKALILKLIQGTLLTSAEKDIMLKWLVAQVIPDDTFK